jgi:hypothetical protein
MTLELLNELKKHPQWTRHDVYDAATSKQPKLDERNASKLTKEFV